MEGMAPGFVFLPTDEQLINEYLLKKEKGLPLPGQAVVERELYGEKSPWEVLNGDHLLWQESKTRDGKTRKIKYMYTIYVLTPLKKASQNRIRRTAGCGRWQENGTQEILNDSDEVIGIKKMLVFMVVDSTVFEGADEGLIKGHWIMHEYTLKNENFPFALCKITRDTSKNVKRAPNNAQKRKASVVEEEEANNWERKGKHDCHESNSTFTVPGQLTSVEDVKQFNTVSTPSPQSVPVMGLSTNSGAVNQLPDFGIVPNSPEGMNYYDGWFFSPTAGGGPSMV